jgi:hypothetical protein
MKKINKKTENRLNMYKVVYLLMSSNIAIFALIIGINNAYLAFETMLGKLESLVQQKLLITTGLTLDKKAMKKQLATFAARIGGALHAFADEKENNELMKAVHFSASRIWKMRDNDAVETCRNIHTLALANAADLVHYGIDNVMLTTFDTAIDLFDAKAPAPIKARAHSAMLTKEIYEMDVETSGICRDRLDKAMLLLEPANPEFVMEYFKARKISDIGIRHRVEEVPVETPDVMGYVTGTICDSQTLEPLEDVSLRFTSNLTGTIYTYETDEEGDYFADELPSGKYDITVEYPTYKTQFVLNVEIKMNDELNMDFDMQSEEVVPPVPE